MDRITGGGYMSGGVDHSENVKLCMKLTQTENLDGGIFRYSRNKSQSFSLPKSNTPFANRSANGYLGLGPFEPNKAPGIPSYCSMKDPYLEDYFTRKFTRMLSPNLPLRDSYYSSLDVERIGLRGSRVRPSSAWSTNKSESLYKVAVTTADVKGAGTSVPIYITIRGDRSNLQRTRLKRLTKPSKKKSGKCQKTVVKFNPGSTNIFPLRCGDLGELESIMIEHDGIEPKDSWLLQGIEIMNTNNKKIWMFPCNHWLSLYKEDGRVSRELFAFKSIRTKYEIVVVTGDLPDAGTDARVYISLFGRTGVSPQLLLEKENNNTPQFQKAQSSRFVIAATCVGPLTKIRLRHDESGSNNSWYVDRICVTDLKHPEWRYFFQIKNWFSRNHGDGAVARDVRGCKEITGIANRTTYKISIYTANKPGAGTKAHILLQIFGTNGESPLITIPNKEGLIEGSIYEHMEPMKQLGSLKKIKIGHDNYGSQPRWLLDKIIINDMELSRVFEFPCGEWLSDSVGESLVKDLTAKQSTDQQSSYKYILHLTTGSRNKADTTSRVYVNMCGPEKSDLEEEEETKRKRKPVAGSEDKMSESGRIWIQGAKFSKGRTDVAEVELSQCLSPIGKLTAGINVNGKKPDWFLDDIVVYCPQTGVEQSFICGKWLSTTQEGCLPEQDLVEDINKRKFKQSKENWQVSIHTTDVREGGSSAKCILVLYSKDKKSEEVCLNSEGEKFEKGSVRDFKIDITPVGVPHKLRLQNDNTGSNPAWHVDKILMKRIATNDEFLFPCQRWLSITHDDKSLIRELPAEGPGIVEVAYVCYYRVQIYTGSKPYSGTDANVFVNLFGSYGDSGDRPLTESSTNSNKFEKGQLDEFMIEAVDLGDIYKIRLGHDGKMAGSGWYVEKVIVCQEDNPANSMTFKCQCWFDTQEGDGLIVRELTGAAMLGKVSYNVEVKTGTEVGAGTDANVFLTIFGSKGDTGDIQLKSSDSAINKFESGNIDKFTIESEDIGEVRSIRLSQDCTGANAAWLVDKLVVSVSSTGLRYEFMIGKWLNKKQMYIEADPTKVGKIDKTIPYQITVFTGDMNYAGTDAHVFIQIYGKEKKTDQIPLVSKTNTFERNSEDIFKINATDVGKIQKIRIGHDGKGPGAGWFLEKLLIEKLVGALDPQISKSPTAGRSKSIYSVSSGSSVEYNDGYSVPRKSVSIRPGVDEDIELYWFLCARWLATDEDDGMIVRELLPMDDLGRPLSDLREVEYRVDIKTGTVSGAGTDANVFLTIYGTKGDSGERAMKQTINKSKNKFEDNSLDSFMLKAIDLGMIEKVKIRHDNSGGGAAWYLEYIMITDDVNNEYLYPCYKWLARNEDDGLIAREIFTATPDALNLWKQNKLCESTFRIHQEDKLESFNIKVFTSNQSFSGTNANVYIYLFGESNDSGMIPLKTSLTYRDKFERGHCDEFEIKSAGLGDLKKIKIGHDGSGGNSDWHLEKVEVSATKLGRTWVFPCNEWISKTRGGALLERELYPQEGLTQISNPKITYEITTYTTDQKGAGTNAEVYIQLYGRDGCTEKKTLASPIDRSGKFKRGAEDIFYVELEDIEEPIQKIRIGHDGTGLGAGWHLDKVTVKRLNEQGKNAVTYLFPCNRWLAKDEDDRAIERELLPTRIKRAIERNGTVVEKDEDFIGLHQKKKYLIKVMTGNETGINCNVFLKVYGENGDTGERQLSNALNHTDKFEKNNTDEFEWEAVDIGRIFRIDIRHDNSGLFKKDWYLDNVEVVDTNDNEIYKFYCEKWLSKNKEDRKIKRTFYVPGYIGDKVSSISQSRRSGSMGSFDSMRDGSVNTTATGGGTMYSFEDETDSASIYRGEMISYIVTVVTGPDSDMGSNGPIWVRFHGPNNKKTNKIRLQKLDGSAFEPRSKEVISVEGLDLDSIKQIEITNEEVDKQSAWYVESINVQMPTKGKSYHVHCGTWLSRFKGERQQSRVFVIKDPMMTKFTPKVNYMVTIVTGDAPNAGTDSSLFIQLFGSDGISALYTLEKMESRFDRACRDRIYMDMDNVGDIKRIRLENDGRGERPHWFLEKIEIRNEKTMDTYEFEYNDYLSFTLGQKKQLTVDLAPVSDSKRSNYMIKVKTSDVKGSNINANVLIKIFGEYCDSGEIQLRNCTTKSSNSKLFQQNQLDEFEIENMLSLGELSRVQIWHDDKRRGRWHLEWVEIVERVVGSVGGGFGGGGSRDNKWRFPCNKWLSIVEDDKQILRELLFDPSLSALPSYAAGAARKPKSSKFDLSVLTGDKKDAGMHHNVWFRFHGSTGFSEIYEMKNSQTNPYFVRGATDKIKVEFKYIGDLIELMFGVYRNMSADVTNLRWYCHEVRVKDEFTLKEYVFNVRKWISIPERRSVNAEEGGMLLEISQVIEDPGRKKVKEIQKCGLIKYEVVVMTGDIRGAGTNANVFITLYGVNGDSGRRALLQKGRDLFERKQEDRFSIESIDLGQLNEIKIEHDNSGISADWFLDKILVINKTTNSTLEFDCKSWLSKNKGDGHLWKILTPS